MTIACWRSLGSVPGRMPITFLARPVSLSRLTWRRATASGMRKDRGAKDASISFCICDEVFARGLEDRFDDAAQGFHGDDPGGCAGPAANREQLIAAGVAVRIRDDDDAFGSVFAGVESFVAQLAVAKRLGTAERRLGIALPRDRKSP